MKRHDICTVQCTVNACIYAMPYPWSLKDGGSGGGGERVMDLFYCEFSKGKVVRST